MVKKTVVRKPEKVKVLKVEDKSGAAKKAAAAQTKSHYFVADE
jgi:hypothetical protein